MKKKVVAVTINTDLSNEVLEGAVMYIDVRSPGAEEETLRVRIKARNIRVLDSDEVEP